MPTEKEAYLAAMGVVDPAKKNAVKQTKKASFADIIRSILMGKGPAIRTNASDALRQMEEQEPGLTGGMP